MQIYTKRNFSIFGSFHIENDGFLYKNTVEREYCYLSIYILHKNSWFFLACILHTSMLY